MSEMPASAQDTVKRMAAAIRDMTDEDLLRVFQLARAGRAAQSTDGEPVRHTSAPSKAKPSAPSKAKPSAPSKAAAKAPANDGDAKSQIMADPELVAVIRIANAAGAAGVATSDVAGKEGLEGLNSAQSARRLKRLVKLGALEKRGEKKFTRYYIAGQAPAAE